MSPTAKKRPGSGVASKMHDEEAQGTRQHPVSKLIERTRLKSVLKKLALLKLLKSSNRRIQELHNLAKRCWNSLTRVPKTLNSSSGDNISPKVKENNNTELQEAGCSTEKPKPKRLEPTEELKEVKPKKPKLQVDSGVKCKAKRTPEAVPQREERRKQEAPRTTRESTCPRARCSQQSSRAPRAPGVVFLKTYGLGMPLGDTKQQRDRADRWVWFEGLPTRIRLPGPRVMCRASTLRLVKRCCTRYCSATLELPMCHPYRA
ncbi:TP53-target gene 5 protein [Echinops telfairi]|uniref:TP53-target gene 5 protein n=1 Tax=Echinops telfairi TaxID=9371 RepID=A0ABM0IEN3_ECHTE|nr:TP53-target gene 5 protein [Echinops telfairi]